MYVGGARFESRLEHRLFLQAFCGFAHSRHENYGMAVTAFFCTLWNALMATFDNLPQNNPVTGSIAG